MRDTIDMAREAGWEMDDSFVLEPEVIWYVSQGQLERLVALVRADERALAASVQEPDAFDCGVYSGKGKDHAIKHHVSYQPAPVQEPAAHDYRTKYDRACHKCLSQFCPGNCIDTTPPAQPAVQWHPVETAPKDVSVLLYGAKRLEVCVGMHHSRDGWVTDTTSEWASMYPPTHWMPLPAAPEKGQP